MKKGESVSTDALSRDVYAASTSAAMSQSPLLMRTSSRIEVIRRVRTSRPFADRRDRPPRSKFSCTYVELTVTGSSSAFQR